MTKISPMPGPSEDPAKANPQSVSFPNSLDSYKTFLKGGNTVEVPKNGADPTNTVTRDDLEMSHKLAAIAKAEAELHLYKEKSKIDQVNARAQQRLILLYAFSALALIILLGAFSSGIVMIFQGNWLGGSFLVFMTMFVAVIASIAILAKLLNVPLDMKWLLENIQAFFNKNKAGGPPKE